jgi:hypothetical protein
MDEEAPVNGPENMEVQMGSQHFVPNPFDALPPLPPSYWVKKFLACNPFYLISAALLLYGFYLVSSDGNFPGREAAQFGFNFGSLQFYEFLLVFTAIILARRRIWYDSVLLTGLENLLVLVPFILVSQAALLNQRTVWLVCAAVGVAALVRFWGLKRFFRELNLPPLLLACGAVLLLVNVALPLIYRHLHESKFGTKPTEGAAFEMDRYSWLVLLPLLVALINILPRPKKLGNLLPETPWVPIGFFLLWLVGSVVHLYCLSYVYNFDWEYLFAVPLLWVALWSIHGRHSDFLSRPMPAVANALLLPQAAVPFLALSSKDHWVFPVLVGLNIVIYATLFYRNRGNRTAFHLFLVSLASLPAGFLKPVEPRLPAGLDVNKWLLLAGTVYVLYWVMRSRNANMGLLGAWIVAIATLLLAKNTEVAIHPAVQLAMAFLLLHSLRWDNREPRAETVLRFMAGSVWLLHALFLAHSGWTHAMLVVYGTGGFGAGASVWFRYIRGNWKPALVPIAACAVMLTQPASFLVIKTQSAPSGLLAMMGSFLLFGLGTLAALTKAKWHAPSPSVITTAKPDQMN